MFRKAKKRGSPGYGAVETNLTSIHEDAVIPGLAECVGDLALRELWCRSHMGGSDPTWLWQRLAAVALTPSRRNFRVF